jgi:actin-related protein
MLFNPDLFSSEEKSIQENINSMIKKFDEESREIFLENILISGGNCGFLDFSKRLKNEIRNLVPGSYIKHVKIHQNQNLLFSSFNGAKIISSMSSFKGMSISKEDYDELGAELISSSFF